MHERGGGVRRGDKRTEISQAVACLPLERYLKHPLRAETRTDTDDTVVVDQLLSPYSN